MSAPAEKIQLVDGDGAFCEQDLQQFVAATKLVECKTDYQVVAIMGPQSSGKSTLLNHMFGTTFVMMDAMAGRGQTTKGIWLSRAPKLSERTTLVLDLEGSDGRERGEDDTNFERQSALFALAVADVLLVNVWCHDIGREQGSGKPLLKTIFQVNLKLFSPDPSRKRTVLLFVIRDKTKTPLPKLVEVMESDLSKMWDTISKPPQYTDSKISDFFDVQYAGMSHFEEKYEDFLADTVMLRRRFTPDGDDTLCRPNDHLPGAAFSLSCKKIWEVIRTQKDLNLPAHKVMVANIRCAEIAADQLRAFSEDQAWQALEGAARAEGAGVVRGFSTTLSGLMDSCIQGYEADALYFDAKVRDAKLAELRARLHETVAPAVEAQVKALHTACLGSARKELKVVAAGGGAGSAGSSKVQFAAGAAAVRASTLASFKSAFAEDLKIEGHPQWDGKTACAAFESDLDSLIASVRKEEVGKAVAKAEKGLAGGVSGPVITLLDACPSGLWAKLHAVTKDAAAVAERGLLQSLEGFALSSAERAELSAELMRAAAARLDGHVREAALTRMSRLKDRFTEVFTLDANKTPRMWGARDNIPAIAKQARLAAATVLGQLAVVRSPKEAAAAAAAGEGAPGDAVEAAVLRLARRDLEEGAEAASSAAAADEGTIDILTAAAWPNVDEGSVLLQPHEVRATWREFMATSNVLVQQALQAQLSNKAAGSRPPPFWAILAILFLGWNEFMTLLWNPFYLILGLLVFLFGRTLYQELEVDAEMSRGALPGALAIAAKLGPATRAVSQRTVESFQTFVSHMPEELQSAKKTLQAAVTEQELSSSMSRAGGGGSSSSSSAAAPGHASASGVAPGPSAGGLSKRHGAPGEAPEGRGASVVEGAEGRKEQ